TGGFANEGNSITIKDSRVYTIGVFGQSLDIGDTTLNCMGSRDSYVSCYSVDGEFVWASDFGVSTGINHVLGNSIAVDQKGAIYVGGEYSGGASFGGSNLTPNGSFDMFLFKLHDLVIPASTNHYMQKPRLEIYPNPNHGIFEIQTAGQIKIDISIFDNNGKLILKKAVISGQQIDISSFPEGIYYLQKTAEQGQLKKILYIKE
ncbi:MAG: T9SS type A sorting domain-containing protein, partial [Bacteroidetes bacterium]|nr:T9SS type A sorting domain-containing protein [Bacteroidota bacterium]